MKLIWRPSWAEIRYLGCMKDTVFLTEQQRKVLLDYAAAHHGLTQIFYPESITEALGPRVIITGDIMMSTPYRLKWVEQAWTIPEFGEAIYDSNRNYWIALNPVSIVNRVCMTDEYFAYSFPEEHRKAWDRTRYE